MPQHQHLLSSRERFAELLSCCPHLQKYWDLEKGTYKPSALKKAMGYWSSSESFMAKFVEGVWCWKIKGKFDLVDGASSLDHENRKIIADWLMDPFWQ